MKKHISVLGLIVILGLVSAEANAGWFGRKSRSSSSSSRTYYDNAQVVDQLPHEGATRVKDGWHWVFRYTGPNSGTWYGTHPVGTSSSDYYNGYPRHGSTRYKNGLRWEYNAYDNTWYSEWYTP